VRVAGAVGGLGGTGDSLGAVSTAGSVAALGATDVALVLAIIGGLVGGGMVPGLATTTTAPLTVGARTYRLYDWVKSWA